jgi:hypothetical protein
MNTHNKKSVDLLKEYISALILNINRDLIPENIDVIFSGGAFNGLFGYGISLFLHELEERKITKIQRISGCSIGSLIGVNYIMKNINNVDIDNIFTKIHTCFREKCIINVLYELIEENINNLFKDNSQLSILKNRLYINYFNVEKLENCVISEFNTRKELIDTIYKSCFLPFIIDGNCLLENKYMDGIFPYIFNDKKFKCLYINLLTFNKIYRVLFTKNEKNISYRLLVGVSDFNQFLLEGNSDMCSWRDNWSYKKILISRLLEYIVYIISFILYFLSRYGTRLGPSFKETIFYKITVAIIKKCIENEM